MASLIRGETHALMTRAIIALDVPSFDDAVSLVDRLGDECDFYKVGLQLYAADGPDTVQWLVSEGKSVFVDLKAHDIPNTVRGVARSVAALGASLLSVHASGGEAMLRAAVEGAGVQDGTGCGILAVTVLTSFDAPTYGAATGRESVDLAQEVLRFGAIARSAGTHGVVCSGREAAFVQSQFSGALKILVPGVRPAGTAAHDQVRIVTPAEAAAAGASYVVIGRAVTAAPDPVAALTRIRAELQLARESKNARN
jgi:orotidine-5'-phosphate decarboxylase